MWPLRPPILRLSAPSPHNHLLRTPQALPDGANPPSTPPFPDRRLAGPVPLPSLRHCAHFINLTNGLEALPLLTVAGVSPVHTVRLQSTLCEQGAMERVVADLDSSLLLHLALGHTCLVYDFGSRNKARAAPRAIWYGLEFVRYALTTMWGLEAPGRAFLRGHDAKEAFDGHIRRFSTATKRKLRYYEQYIPPEGLSAVQLYGVYRRTEHDVDFDFYKGIAHNYLLPEALFGERKGGAAAEALPSPQEMAALLDGDAEEAVQRLFGMELFLGGLSHAEFARWKAAHGVGVGSGGN